MLGSDTAERSATTRSEMTAILEIYTRVRNQPSVETHTPMYTAATPGSEKEARSEMTRSEAAAISESHTRVKDGREVSKYTLQCDVNPRKFRIK